MIQLLHSSISVTLRIVAFAAFIAVYTGGIDLPNSVTTFAQTANDDGATESTKFGIQRHGSIVYHTGETYRLTCDVYQPLPEVESDSKMPAIVMIHGGAWRAGTKFSMLRHARRLARVGYVVMAINYRLAPKYPWPAQIEDCRAALDWLNKHAAQYHVDTDRVGVYGYSAGAQMACLLAATNEENPVIKIKAVAAGGTPAEFSWIDADSNALAYWLGAPRSDAEDVYQNASPTTFVTPDDPPFFLFHGETDLIVPAESARRLHAALQKNNVESKLVEVPGYGHIATFSNMDLMKDVIKFFDLRLRPSPLNDRK